MKARVKYPKLKSKSEKKTSEVKIMSSTQVEEITWGFRIGLLFLKFV